MKRLADALDTAAPGTATVPAQWQDGLVLLCSKCSGQQWDADGPETAPSWTTWELRCWLKDRLTEKGLWPRVRVVTTSCLGVCDDGRITCALGSEAGGPGGAGCWSLDPATEAEKLLAAIEASVGKA